MYVIYLQVGIVVVVFFTPFTVDVVAMYVRVVPGCCQVDPAVIGGMVVTIGDKYIDMSMATKIKAYTNLISQAA